MSTLLQDIRYGLRMLLKHKGFSLVAIVALGLGIGANTAIFSLVNGVLLRALPFPDAERIVYFEGKIRPRESPTATSRSWISRIGHRRPHCLPLAQFFASGNANLAADGAEPEPRDSRLT
ncbi:MAG: hypothetical protein ABR589_12390 [Chthoniobacterales bacterium]